MLKITPELQQHIDNYNTTRHEYLQHLHHLQDAITHEILSIEETHPTYQTKFPHTAIIHIIEHKTLLHHQTQTINRKAQQLGLNGLELWEHITQNNGATQ